jgi:hypothetical protein
VTLAVRHAANSIVESRDSRQSREILAAVLFNSSKVRNKSVTHATYVSDARLDLFQRQFQIANDVVPVFEAD